MRVAHIIKVTRISGAERHLLLLLPALRERGIEARLILLVEPANPMDEMLRQARDLGISTERVVIRHDMDPTLPGRLTRRLRKIQPNIAHTHLLHADLYGALAARLAGVGTVITSRHNDDKFRYHPLWRLVAPWLWRMTTGGIAISESIERFLLEIEKAPRNKIRRVHYGMPAPTPSEAQRRQARQALSAELSLPRETLVLGMVCRLTRQKGVACALEAFARVAACFPTARLVVAGDGELAAALRRQAEALDIDARVHWLGWRDDAANLIAASDIMLMPSLWEGFGLALLEAMTRGTPIVASRVGAIPEVVAEGETGLLVKPGDVAGLAEAISRLLGDEALRKRMGERGAERLKARFSLDTMAAATLEVYESLLKSRRDGVR